MNKDMIKSLRQAMLSTAAAALVAIGFMACSDEMFTTQSTPVPANGYKFSIPASMGSGETRAIAYNSETGGYDATFETSEMIFVFDVTQNAVSTKKEEGGGYNNTYLHPDANAKTANLIGELSFIEYDRNIWEYGNVIAPKEGDELMLFYNNDNDVFRYDHNPNEYYLNNSGDYALATVKITSIGDDGVIHTSPASFENLQSIYKINFTGISSGVKIKRIDVQSEKDQLVRNYHAYRTEWPEEFGVVNYTYEGEGIDQHELTFMLRYSNNPENETSGPGDMFTFLALGSDGHYYKGTKSVTTELKNGKYYQAEVAMEDAGEALTLTNNATGEQVVISDSERSLFSTKDASYTLEKIGYNTPLEWFGGNQKLILNGVTISGYKECLIVGSYDPEFASENYLVLNGDNALNNFRKGYRAVDVLSNSSLYISAASSEDKLTITSTGIGIGNNAKVILESGEVTINAHIDSEDNSSFIISKDGKLRMINSASFREGLIRAASGYVLNTATEGDYVVYTVTDAPAPKDLSTVTTADLGSIVCSDGKVYVPNCGLPEGVSTVGMIANISSTGHGLAVAMSKIKVRKDFDDGGWTTYEYFSWDDSAEYNNGKTATDIFNDWSSNNSVTFGTWRIATKEDCQNMILSCRIDGDATEASDNNMISNGFKSKLIEAGIIYDDYLYCWTNTTVDNDWRFYMSLERNGEDSIANFYTTDNSATSSILPVLEF